MPEITHQLSSPFQAQLNCEWIRHRSVLMLPLWTLLIGTFVVPFFSHFGVIIACYSVLALIVCTRLAADDVIQGTEEFALSQPATRLQRYLSRMLLALVVPLSAWLAVEMMHYSVSPWLWGCLVDSGFADNYLRPIPEHTRFLAVSIPALLGALCFSWGAQTKAPVQAIVVVTISCIVVGVLAGVCTSIEGALYGRADVTGRLLLLVSSVAAPVLMLAGLPLYLRKEISGQGKGAAQGAVVVVIVVVVLIVVLLTHVS